MDGEGKGLSSSSQYGRRTRDHRAFRRKCSHRIMAREREIGIGVKQKGITISVGSVATGKCQNVKWLGKGSYGECTLSSLGRHCGENPGHLGATAQSRTGPGSAWGGRGSKNGTVCEIQGIPGVKLLGHMLGFAPFLPFNEGIDSFSDEIQV